jgi:hypothetical protein
VFNCGQQGAAPNTPSDNELQGAPTTLNFVIPMNRLARCK